MFARHFAHERDEQHVVIDRQVALFVDGGELKLVGGHFIVARLAGNAETEGLYFEIAHEFGHALGDGAEIVVFHLLILGAVVPHEGASGEQEVGARGVEAFVDEEVLLFPTEVGVYAHRLVVEVGTNGFGGAVHCGDRLFERGFVVEGFAGVADEDGGNHQRVVDDEDGAGGIPRRVAAGFEGGADAAVGERGGVGLLLHKEFTGEVFDHAALAVVLHEGVVFLGRALGEGLEPVGIMRDAHLDGPLLHALCDGIGGVHIKRASGVEGFGVALIDFEGKILAHLLLVENVGGVIRRRTFGRCGHGDGAFFESLFHDFETECAHVLMPGCVAQSGRHAFGGWGEMNWGVAKSRGKVTKKHRLFSKSRCTLCGFFAERGRSAPQIVQCGAQKGEAGQFSLRGARVFPPLRVCFFTPPRGRRRDECNDRSGQQIARRGSR